MGNLGKTEEDSAKGQKSIVSLPEKIELTKGFSNCRVAEFKGCTRHHDLCEDGDIHRCGPISIQVIAPEILSSNKQALNLDKERLSWKGLLQTEINTFSKVKVDCNREKK